MARVGASSAWTPPCKRPEHGPDKRLLSRRHGDKQQSKALKPDREERSWIST